MKNVKLAPWQKVILRNYGTVPTENIAKVIGASENQVVESAIMLGLKEFAFNGDWLKKGFVTVIRNNWDLLTEEQIAALLGTSLKELKTLLVEYDFLDVKLGEKPKTDSVEFSQPSKSQKISTENVRKIIEENYIKPQRMPFDFFSDYVEPCYIAPENRLIKDSFTSAYCAKYSGALLDSGLSDYPEAYLEKLSKTGTNGIWLSDTLRNLAEFPFDTKFSPDYRERIKNLRKLTERCASFGIGVYLYLNEPRSLSDEFFKKYPHLRGQRADDGTYCLCTSCDEVKEYLYNAVKSVAESVPLLKGVMTITMSENPTHCYSRKWNDGDKIYTDCPRCGKRKPNDVVVEINNIYAKALRDGNGKTKLISNVWAWGNFAQTDDDVLECISRLDSDIEVLCVSEYKKDFIRGGVKCSVDDYSISVVGPSDFTKKVLTYAKNTGHKIWAKVQLNNSWECSAVPFIPAFDLMLEHIENVKKLGVDGVMTGWSLGGYPGGALPLCNSACGAEKFDDAVWYEKTYGNRSSEIKKAVKIFSEAFKEFPFSIDSLYFGGHNLGAGNLWSLDKQNRTSTMVCYTFDDCEKYVSPYGVKIYEEQLKRLCVKWKEGLKIIENIGGNAAVAEFVNCAEGCYCHFESALNLTIFSEKKADKAVNKEILHKCVESERGTVKKLYSLISKDPKIGFEMTNHYYYNANLLLEKLVNLKEIEQDLIK